MNVKINFSIPVTLFDYRESNNPLYSFAKLKIFYVGQTADRRLFTKEFSDQLIETLPYVPVVGFYNDEKEDFEGHHREVQHIYGMVPEDTGVEYIKEDGREYAVCDVILYTGRKDKTGDIASKIVGKQHSLELNPEDTTYEINKDAEGKIINIEFKTGSLLGLSVLGDDEKPAFDGSAFFNEDSELMQVFMGFKSQIQEFTKHITQRGEDMENKIFESALSFLKRAYSEKISIMYNKLYEIYGDEFYVPQLFDNYIVVGYWNAELGEVEYSRLPYSENEDGDIIFEDSVTVYPRYLSKEEATLWENNMGTNASNQDVEENMQEGDVEDTETTEMEEQTKESSEALNAENSVETSEEMSESTEAEEDDEEEEEEDYKKDKDDDEDEDEDYQAALTEENAEEGTEENSEAFSSNDNEDDQENEGEEITEAKEVEEEQEETFSTTLTDSEREELETFRREKKFGLISSFEDDLSKEFLNQLNEKVDEYSFDELEVILSKEFTKVTKQNKSKTSKTNAFIYNSTSSTKSEQDRVKELVNRYKNIN